MIKNSTIETSIAIIEIKEDILYLTLKDDADLELEDVEEMIVAREKVQEGRPYLVLADIRKIWHASREARAHAASKKMARLNIAMAIVTDSMPSKMLANFFIKLNKPVTPTKMFNSKEKALDWLKKVK